MSIERWFKKINFHYQRNLVILFNSHTTRLLFYIYTFEETASTHVTMRPNSLSEWNELWSQMPGFNSPDTKDGKFVHFSECQLPLWWEQVLVVTSSLRCGSSNTPCMHVMYYEQCLTKNTEHIPCSVWFLNPWHLNSDTIIPL